MDPITFTDDNIEIDATIVTKSLRLDPEALRNALREGRVTRTLEKGEDADAGRYRVTFFSSNRRLRLTFTAEGILLHTSAADYSRSPRAPGPVVSP